MKRQFENRPWGNFNRFTLNEKSTVKIITVLPKKRLSLQYHKNRTEFWYFLDNPAKVTVGKKTFKVREGSEVKIKKGELHRVEALNKTVRFLEIAFGNFKESDIERVQDDFSRV